MRHHMHIHIKEVVDIWLAAQATIVLTFARLQLLGHVFRRVLCF